MDLTLIENQLNNLLEGLLALRGKRLKTKKITVEALSGARNQKPHDFHRLRWKEKLNRKLQQQSLTGKGNQIHDRLAFLELSGLVLETSSCLLKGTTTYDGPSLYFSITFLMGPLSFC